MPFLVPYFFFQRIVPEIAQDLHAILDYLGKLHKFFVR